MQSNDNPRYYHIVKIDEKDYFLDDHLLKIQNSKSLYKNEAITNDIDFRNFQATDEMKAARESALRKMEN